MPKPAEPEDPLISDLRRFILSFGEHDPECPGYEGQARGGRRRIVHLRVHPADGRAARGNGGAHRELRLPSRTFRGTSGAVRWAPISRHQVSPWLIRGCGSRPPSSRQSSLSLCAL